ncbi:transposase, partial [Streptomyces mirabilis]|uniref:transposase n=1 Tax=Streptomyces mirabilis TaxID=68239 RepID=UPI00368E54FC
MSPRKDQRATGDCYLRGLMADGRRKSIQAMASRLPDASARRVPDARSCKVGPGARRLGRRRPARGIRPLRRAVM